jgi:hypothetical protein
MPPIHLSTKLIALLNASRHQPDRTHISDSGAEDPSRAPPFHGRRSPYDMFTGLTPAAWLKVIVGRYRDRKS